MSVLISKIIRDLNPTNLRYLFYLVTPNETMHYKTMEEVPNILDQTNVWMLVLVLVEYFFLDDKKIAFNDTITSINAGILSLLMKFSGKYMSAFLYPYVFNYFRIVDLDPHATSTWVICLLTQDLAYYLAHRAVHEFGVFWSFHQMHHSSEYYNLSTALRQGMWQDFGTCGFDLVQAFFIPPNIFIVHRYLNVAYQFWLHTELVPYLGPLEYVFNTPSSHRVHHGRNPYCIDRNYGGTLIIWDRMFGTYEPEREEQIAYGLVTNVRTFNQMYCQLFEFKELGFDKGQMKDEKGNEIFPGFWNKVKTAFMPPGYFPGVKTKWFFFWKCLVDNTEGIPEVEANPAPFDLPLSKYLKFYLTAQFLFTVSAALHFNQVRVGQNWSEFLTEGSFIIASMQMYGYYFDHKSFAMYFDIARLLGLVYYGLTFGATSVVIFAISSVISIVLLNAFGHLPKAAKVLKCE